MRCPSLAQLEQLIAGRSREDALKVYGDVTVAGLHTCAHCMPYENNLNVFIARDRHVPIENAWVKARHFE